MCFITRILFILLLTHFTGHIAEGSDADLVIWDPNECQTITAKAHNIAADFNIFEGQKITGVASTVLIGGKVVVFERQMNPSSRNGGHSVATDNSRISDSSFAEYIMIP